MLKYKYKRKFFQFLSIFLAVLNLLSCTYAAELAMNYTQETKGHKHTFACYEEYHLTCTNTDADHHHSEGCYEYSGEIVCGLNEGDTLPNDGDQYDETHVWSCEKVLDVLICDKEEHTHTDECYNESPIVEEAVKDSLEIVESGVETMTPEEVITPSTTPSEPDALLPETTPDTSTEGQGESDNDASMGEGFEIQDSVPTDPEQIDTDPVVQNPSETTPENPDSVDTDNLEPTPANPIPTESNQPATEPSEAGSEDGDDVEDTGSEEGGGDSESNEVSENDNSENSQADSSKESDSTPTGSEDSILYGANLSNDSTSVLICGKEEHTHSDECYQAIYKYRVVEMAPTNGSGITINGTWKTSSASGEDKTIEVSEDGRDAQWTLSNSIYFNYGIDFSVSIAPGVSFAKDQVHIFLPYTVVPLRNDGVATFGNITGMLQNNDIWSLKGTAEYVPGQFYETEESAISDAGTNYVLADSVEMPEWTAEEQEEAEALAALEPAELMSSEPPSDATPSTLSKTTSGEKVRYYEIVNDKRSVAGEQKFSFSGYIKDSLWQLIDGKTFEYPIYVVVSGEEENPLKLQFTGSIDTQMNGSFLSETAHQNNYIRENGLKRIYNYNDKLLDRYGLTQNEFDLYASNYAYVEYVFDAGFYGNKEINYDLKIQTPKGKIVAMRNIDSPFQGFINNFKMLEEGVYTISSPISAHSFAKDGEAHSFGVLVRYKFEDIDPENTGHLSTSCTAVVTYQDADSVDNLEEYQKECTLTHSSDVAFTGYHGDVYGGRLLSYQDTDTRLGAGALSDLAAGLDTTELPVYVYANYRAYMNNEMVNDDYVANPEVTYGMDVFVDKIYLSDSEEIHDCDGKYKFTQLKSFTVMDGYQEMDESGNIINRKQISVPESLRDERVEVWVRTTDPSEDDWVKDGEFLVSNCWDKDYKYGKFNHDNVTRVKIHYPCAYGYAEIAAELDYQLNGEALNATAKKAINNGATSIDVLKWGGIIPYSSDGKPYAAPSDALIIGSSSDDIKNFDLDFWRSFYEKNGLTPGSPYRMTNARSLTKVSRNADMTLGIKAWDVEGNEIRDEGDLNIHVLDHLVMGTKATVNLGYTSLEQTFTSISNAKNVTNHVANIREAVFFTLLPEGLEYYSLSGGTPGGYISAAGLSRAASPDNGVTYLWHKDNYAGTNRTMVCYSVDQPLVSAVRNYNHADEYGLVFGASVTARPVTADILPGTQTVNTAGFFVLEDGSVFDFTNTTESTLYTDNGAVHRGQDAFIGLETAWTEKEPGAGSEKLSIVGQKREINVTGRPVSTELRILSKGPNDSQGYAAMTQLSPTDAYTYRLSFIIGGADKVSNLGIVVNTDDYVHLINSDIEWQPAFNSKITGIDTSLLPAELKDSLEVYVNTSHVDINEYNNNPNTYAGKNIASLGWEPLTTETDWNTIKALYFYFGDKEIRIPEGSTQDYYMFHIGLNMETPEDGHYQKDFVYDAYCQAVYINSLFGNDSMYTSSGSNIAGIQVRTDGGLESKLAVNNADLDGTYGQYSSSAKLLGSGKKFNYNYQMTPTGSISDVLAISNYLPEFWSYQEHDFEFWLNQVKQSNIDVIYAWTGSDETVYNNMYTQAEKTISNNGISSILGEGWVEYESVTDKSQIHGLLFSLGSHKLTPSDKFNFTVSNVGSDEVHAEDHNSSSVYPIQFKTLYRIYGTKEFGASECDARLHTIESKNRIQILSAKTESETPIEPMDLKPFYTIQGNLAENLSHISMHGISKTNSYQNNLILNPGDTFTTVVDIPTVSYGKDLTAIVYIDQSAGEITGLDVIGAKSVSTDKIYVLHSAFDGNTESLESAGFVEFDNYDQVQAIAIELGPDDFINDNPLTDEIQARFVLHWKSSNSPSTAHVKADLYYDSIGCLERKMSSSENTINFNSQIYPSIDLSLDYPEDASVYENTLMYPSDFTYTIKFGLTQNSSSVKDVVLWTPMNPLLPTEEQSISRFFTINSFDTTYWTDQGIPITVFGSKSSDTSSVSEYFKDGISDGNHQFVTYINENWDIINSSTDLSEYKQLAFWLGNPQDGSFNLNPSAYGLNAADGIRINVSFTTDDESIINFYQGKTINPLNNKAYYLLNNDFSSMSASDEVFAQVSDPEFTVKKTVAHRKQETDSDNPILSLLNWLKSINVTLSEQYSYKLELNATNTVNATDIILFDNVEYKTTWEAKGDLYEDTGDSSQFHCQLEGVDMSEFEADNIPYTIYVKTESESKGTVNYCNGLYYENKGLTPELLQRDWMPANENCDWSMVKQVAIWLGTPEDGSWVDTMTNGKSVLSCKSHSAYLLMKTEFSERPLINKMISASNGAGLHFQWADSSITIHDFSDYTNINYMYYDSNPVNSHRVKTIQLVQPEDGITALGDATDELAQILKMKPGEDYEYKMTYRVENGATNVVFADSIEHIMGEDHSESSGLIIEMFSISTDTYKIGSSDPDPVLMLKVKNASENTINMISLNFSNPDFVTLLDSLGIASTLDVLLEPGQSQIFTLTLTGLTEPQNISTSVKVFSEEYQLESNLSESISLTVSPQYKTITYKNTTDGDTTAIQVSELEGKSEDEITWMFLGKVSGEYKEWHEFQGWTDSEEEPDTKIANWISYEALVEYMNEDGSVSKEKFETLPLASEDTRIKNAISVKTYPKLTSIRERQFNYCQNLISVDLDENLKKIEASAFELCVNLQSIVIPEKVESIGTSAFSQCHNLTKVIFPENLKTIGDNSFFYCENLSDIEIPSSVEDIGGYAFRMCYNLQSIKIPDKITEIKTYTFGQCTNLINIEFPANLKKIGDSAFDHCENLKSIDLSRYKNFTIIDRAAFAGCTNLESVILPNAIQELGSSCFSGCKNLSKIELPNSITKIYGSAFSECSSLTSIKLPDKITYIYDHTFYKCTNLSNVTIPNGVERIMNGAFQSCSSLTSIYIPDSVTEIGASAFQESGLKSIVLPEDIINIGNKAFYECRSLESAIFQGTFYPRSLGSQMFQNCAKLSSVKLPQNLQVLPFNTFNSCTKLKVIEIPPSVTELGNNIFRGCGCNTIYLPVSVKKIGNATFSNRGCTIYYNGTEKQFEAITKGDSWNEGNNTVVYLGCTIYKNQTDNDNTYIYNNDPLKSEADITKEFLERVPEEYLKTHTFLRWELDPTNENVKLAKWDASLFKIKYLNEDNTEVEEIITQQNYSDSKEKLKKAFWIEIFPNKSLEANMFLNYTLLKTVIIPEGNDCLPPWMFSGCTSLTSVSIPDSVRSMYYNTFYNCSSLVSISLPEKITSIPEYAFYGCSSLEHIDGLDHISYIGQYAFYGCTSLDTVNLSDKLSAIKTYSFANCTSLRSINIPDAVSSIEDGAFYNCESLTSIEIPGSVNNLGTVGNEAFNKQRGDSEVRVGVFEGCKNLNKVTMEDGLTVIGDRTFRDCLKLSSINLPDSLRVIGVCAFYNCDALTSIDIPDNVVQLGSNISSVNLNGETIYGVFENCDSLTTVNLGTNLKQIGACTFYKCGKLKSIDIPDSVTTIGHAAFCDCAALESVTLSDNITELSWRLFYQCKKLTNIVIPDNVTSSNTHVFYGCTSLKTAKLSNSLKNLGKSMFYNCSSLESITIPDSVTSSEDYVFYGCASLKTAKLSNALQNLGKSMFCECSSLKEIVIPNSVTSMGEFVFSDCSALETAKFSCRLSVLNKWTFQNCSALKTVTLPDSISFIDKSAFLNCSSLESLTLPGTLTSIGPFAFSATALKSIEIPDSVVSMDESVFRDCSSLKTIKLSSSLKNIGQCMFYNCLSLEEVSIPESVTLIGAWAFYNCSSLKSCKLPAQVTDLGKTAFCGCKSLKNITLPYGFLTLGDWAFDSCSSLEIIEVPDSVTTINKYAFKNCPNLKTLVLPASITSIGPGITNSCTNATIHFLGTSTQFDAITKDKTWNGGNCPIIYCGDGSCPLHPLTKSLRTTSSFSLFPVAHAAELESYEIFADANSVEDNAYDVLSDTNTPKDAVMIEQSGWKGTLSAIDISDIENKGLTAISFVSTAEVDDWWSVLQPWNDIINANKEIKTLEWYQSNVPTGFSLLTPETDLSAVKSVVVQVVDLRDYDGLQNEYYMTDGDEISVSLKMHIPGNVVEEYPYAWRDSYAFNQFYTLENTMCPGFEGEEMGDTGVLKTKLSKSNITSASLFVNVHLPETGGTGTAPFVIMGSTLILAAWLILKKKKKD